MTRVVDLHPEELLDRDARGELSAAESSRLEAHLARQAPLVAASSVPEAPRRLRRGAGERRDAVVRRAPRARLEHRHPETPARARGARPRRGSGSPPAGAGSAPRAPARPARDLAPRRGRALCRERRRCHGSRAARLVASRRSLGVGGTGAGDRAGERAEPCRREARVPAPHGSCADGDRERELRADDDRRAPPFDTGAASGRARRARSPFSRRSRRPPHGRSRRALRSGRGGTAPGELRPRGRSCKRDLIFACVTPRSRREVARSRGRRWGRLLLDRGDPCRRPRELPDVLPRRRLRRSRRRGDGRARHRARAPRPQHAGG